VGQTEGRSPRSRHRYVTRANQSGALIDAPIPEPLAATLKSAPLLVVVSSGTASGAEMVTAALQSHGRARVGTIQTFSTSPRTTAPSS
jgi:C-terminal processing protease CtpA/Prc